MVLRHAKRRDQHEPSIVAALERHGATVVRLHTPLDLLVGFRGVNFLLEVKMPAGARGGKSSHGQALNEDQQKFINTWRGQSAVVTDMHEALRIIGVTE